MSKKLLQEYRQRKGLSLPKYISSQEGSAHNPIWTSIVEIYIPDSGTVSFSSVGKSTKKGAEEDAASKALEISLCSEPKLSSPKPKLDSSGADIYVNRKIALMVDVENLPKLIFQLPRFGGIDIYAFVGKHHPGAEVDYQQHGAIKIISPSTRQDGTDTCMQTYVGALLHANRYEEYLIASRDHFAGALVDLISADTRFWNGIKATVVTTADHVLEAIKSYTLQS